MYQEVKPSRSVYHVIDSFWTFSNNKTKENFNILPDTCTDIIVDLHQNKSFLSGVMSHYQHRELEAKSDLIGIRFKIEVFGAFSKIPLHETKNIQVELAELFSMKNRNALNQLTDFETIPDKMAFLEKFVEASFNQISKRQDHLVLSVAQNIRKLHGIVDIGAIAKSYHISLRQLERRFKNYMGLTVKEFSNIVRFSHAKKSIAAFTKSSLLEIAYDMGFYDHSHMTYEFKRISGENPSYFR